MNMYYLNVSIPFIDNDLYVHIYTQNKFQYTIRDNFELFMDPKKGSETRISNLVPLQNELVTSNCGLPG
jgi:hypothetical protein